MTSALATLLPLFEEVYQEKLVAVLDEMDQVYQKVADQYGFICRGCEDNCCYSTFHHHTLLEYLYLYKGYLSLQKQQQAQIADAAHDYVNTGLQRQARPICPLNQATRCQLYAYRPMICRLHGIPHELRNRNGATMRHAGCDEFDRQSGQQAYIPFDRTPLYQKMAQTEQKLRQAAGWTGRLHLTVAQMLVSFEGDFIKKRPER